MVDNSEDRTPVGHGILAVAISKNNGHNDGKQYGKTSISNHLKNEKITADGYCVCWSGVCARIILVGCVLWSPYDVGTR